MSRWFPLRWRRQHSGAILLLGLFALWWPIQSATPVDQVSVDVAQALKGLTKKTRFARGLQDQCVDVYEDLEQRARKAGTDFLHNHVANWHHVKNQDRRFDSLSNQLASQETEFSKKYETDIIALSESLQSLEPIKKKRAEILQYQTFLTTKILELNDLASKLAREKFFTEIQFMAKKDVPCLKAISSRWADAYDELKDKEGKDTKVQLRAETESKEDSAKKTVESALNVYEQKIVELYKLSGAVPQLKIRLKDAGFNDDGSFDE